MSQEVEKLRQRVAELEGAINCVLSQRLDDICWMDVYTTLGKLVGHDFNPVLLDRKDFKANCDRFTLHMYDGAPYARDTLTEYMHTLHAVADEHRRAKILLDKAGFGVTGTPLLERVMDAIRAASAG